MGGEEARKGGTEEPGSLYGTSLEQVSSEATSVRDHNPGWRWQSMLT